MTTTSPTLVSEHAKKLRAEAQATLENPETSIRERLDAYEQIDLADRVDFDEHLHRLETRLAPRLRGMLVEEFDRRIAHATARIEREYADNDERRRAGMPFQERRAKLNTKWIAWLEKHREELQQARNRFTPRPVRDWFHQRDLWLAKKRGITYIIRLNFDQTYAED